MGDAQNKNQTKKRVQWAKESIQESDYDGESEMECETENVVRKKNDLKKKKKSKKSNKKNKPSNLNANDMKILDIELLKKVCMNDLRMRYSKGRRGLKRNTKNKKPKTYNAIAIFLKATRFKFENLLQSRVIGLGEFNVIKKEKDKNSAKNSDRKLMPITKRNKFVCGRKRGFHLFNMPPWYSTTEEEDSEEGETKPKPESKPKLSKVNNSRKKRKEISSHQEIMGPRKRTKRVDKFDLPSTEEDSDSEEEVEKGRSKKSEAKEVLGRYSPEAGVSGRPRRAKAKTKKVVKEEKCTYKDSSEFDEDSDAYDSFQGDDDSDDDFDGELEIKIAKTRPQKRLPTRQARNKKNPKLEDFEEEEEEEEEPVETQFDDFDFDILKLEEGSGEEEEEDDDVEEVDIGLSCVKCNEFKKEDERIYVCKNCSFGWHQFCSIPPLYHRPKGNWLCPLCSHISLVQNLEQTLEELDILMEKAEERRLTALIEKSY